MTIKSKVYVTLVFLMGVLVFVAAVNLQAWAMFMFLTLGYAAASKAEEEYDRD